MNDNVESRDIRSRLRNAKGYVFDLDGSLVIGDKRNKGLEALPGAAEVLGRLDDIGIPWRIMTNGTVRIPDSISDALGRAGLDIPAAKIMTPSTVAADYFARRRMQKILVLGVEGVWQPIEAKGLRVVRPLHDDDCEDADAIFLGWYRQIHMDEIEVACNAVWNGAGLFAASMIPFFATRNGRALGSSRAIAAMITSLTGRRATPLGKPSPHVLRDAARLLGCRPAELVVVGDDPDLEVKMALDGQATAVGVHTGIADAEVFAALPAERKPHLSCDSLADLLEFLEV